MKTKSPSITAFLLTSAAHVCRGVDVNFYHRDFHCDTNVVASCLNLKYNTCCVDDGSQAGEKHSARVSPLVNGGIAYAYYGRSTGSGCKHGNRCAHDYCSGECTRYCLSCTESAIPNLSGVKWYCLHGKLHGDTLDTGNSSIALETREPGRCEQVQNIDSIGIMSVVTGKFHYFDITTKTPQPIRDHLISLYRNSSADTMYEILDHQLLMYERHDLENREIEDTEVFRCKAGQPP